MLVLVVTGLLLSACFAAMAALRDLQAYTVPFLVLYGLACAGFGGAVWSVLRKRQGCARPAPRAALTLIAGLAVLFRSALLWTTPPTLSGDVYRYIWDGRLANAGVSPYAHAVNSPLLDPFGSPQRALVNNNWMASPYLPAAQALFALVYRLVPGSPLAFQVAALLCDLLTGWMVVDLLGRLALPREWSLIYFWHPLVVVEFAHGAHVDAWMVCLMMASLWALIALRSRFLSAVALAAATLTKGLPVLLLPVLARRWRWPYLLLYLGLIAAACVPIGLTAGWGLVAPPNGEGLLGALLIYGAYWNFNGGLYHWLEVLFSGYSTPNPVPQEVVGWLPIYAAKAVMALGLVGTLLVVWRKGQGIDRSEPASSGLPNSGLRPFSGGPDRAGRGRPDLGVGLTILWLSLVPLTAYLLLATTVHPWYATWIVPLLPFLGKAPSWHRVPSRHRDAAATAVETPQVPAVEGASSVAEGASLCPEPYPPYLWPLLYFSLVLPLSYLSYLDPSHPREYALVRAFEYVPVYLWLLWAAYPSFAGARRQAA
jgi:alpha-1,6-mannosyltransferase